jgi:AcrR family transcriptional regulator
MPRPSCKESILDAAEAIVLEAGAAHLTLDAVAERSKISKGGLIYHFPSKDALLEAMIGRLMERIERLREQARQELSPGPVNELMVEIRALQALSASDNRLGAALLAVTANQPDLTRTMHEALRARFHNEIAGEDDFVHSSILYFAALGLHFHDLLNLSLLDSQKQEHLFEELQRLACRAREAPGAALKRN